jgi:hypothetical protein
MAELTTTPSSIPIPDPTILTTEQLRRELFNLRELVESRLQSQSDITLERFARIDTVFIETEKRSQALRVADSLALAAALQAAKEAVSEQNRSNGLAISKSEASFIEALKQQQTLFQTEIKSANDKVALITSRLDKGEGHGFGRTEMIGWIIGGIGFIAVVITAYTELRSSGNVQPTVQYVPAPTATPSAPAPVTVPR